MLFKAKYSSQVVDSFKSGPWENVFLEVPLKTFYIKSNSPIVLSGITFEDLYKTGDYCYMGNGVNFSVKSKNSSKIKSDQIEIDTAYYETVSEADRSMDASWDDVCEPLNSHNLQKYLSDYDPVIGGLKRNEELKKSQFFRGELIKRLMKANVNVYI